MAGRHWTPEEDQRLTTLWDSTLTLEEVAGHFPGRTATSIHIHAKRLRLKHTPEQFHEILSKMTAGERNGMWGRPGPNLGKSPSETTRVKLREAALSGYARGTRCGMMGAKNPQWGKPSPMRGKTLPGSSRQVLAEKASVRWDGRTSEWQGQHLMKMRHGWLKWVARRAPTAIERMVEGWLQESGVVFSTQTLVGYYIVDFLVGRSVIETFGDYWHGNPNQYDVLDQMQRTNRGRDRAKDTFLRNHGYRLLTLWETNLHTRPDECRRQITEFLTHPEE